MSDQKTMTPPAFPTVTIHTDEGNLVIPCEPIGDHLAITGEFSMDENGAATLDGTFVVVLRSNGKIVTEGGGCIACARRAGKVLAAAPVDWSAADAEIAAQFAALPGDARAELSRERSLSFNCDAIWCRDEGGPGIVFVPMG